MSGRFKGNKLESEKLNEKGLKTMYHNTQTEIRTIEKELKGCDGNK